nr:hypothetical protein BaRGS_006958 [Batillaria attramentaria]
MQGLPLCTCPSQYICRRRKQRAVCGTDGITYESRCHLRIAACNSGDRIKVDRRGACGDSPLADGKDNTGSGVKRRRACSVTASTCRRRKHKVVCGTDGRTYLSRCLMKAASCQQGVRIKVKSQGVCPRTEVTSTANTVSDSFTAGSGKDAKGRHKGKRGRKDKRKAAEEEKKAARRQRRRERRKQKMEKRRKRRKARGGKGRTRRYKRLSKDQFQRTFGHYTWRY